MEITSLMLQGLVLPAAVIAILFALWMASDVLRRDKGTPAMQDVAGMIFEGAVAFMRRQYITIGVLSVAMAVLIGVLIATFETAAVADTTVYGADLGIRTGIAFIFGAACSMVSGVIGMYVSVKANLRTTAAARQGVVKAVQVAMRGGAVSGFLPKSNPCSPAKTSIRPANHHHHPSNPNKTPTPDRRLRHQKFTKPKRRPNSATHSPIHPLQGGRTINPTSHRTPKRLLSGPLNPLKIAAYRKSNATKSRLLPTNTTRTIHPLLLL